MREYTGVHAVADLIRKTAEGRALTLVGLTGSPGSGKSSFAAELVAEIDDALLLPMDGYHLPQSELTRLGRRGRMGAPDTFDVAAFSTLLERLRSVVPGDTVFARGFDRSIEEPVPDAVRLPIGARTVILVEGNYLLLDEDGWAGVGALLDLRLHLDLEPDERLRRLEARHIRFGKTPQQARAWAVGTDEVNAERIEAAAITADARVHAQEPTPCGLRILHLSDTHLLGDPAARYNRVIDPLLSLEAVLAAHDRVDVDAVVVSGDLSNDGSAASYALLRERVGAWALAHAAASIYALGNHDDRVGFGASGPYDHETDVAGVRILTLDSSVPGGASWGLLSEPTLAWLRERLSASDRPTVIVLHHPPIEAVTPLHATIGLQNAHDFWAAVEGSSVRLVLAGHWHHQLVDSTHGIPVVVTPGVANRTDVLAGPEHERSVVASAGSLIELLPRGIRVTATEVPVPHRGEELFDVTGTTLDEWRGRLGFGGDRTTR
ncbi:metallophosphoesterase [Microbacteriaceae bacterium VKM Ac-2854]|nr:metallophosphoesterase [Microbacteriaceae bacterium VKM Ac-2854]